jgi:homogentisate phytyltransferase / homogentisate geranylgeranyltransferase
MSTFIPSIDKAASPTSARPPLSSPLRTAWEFCRPHTIIGTTFAVFVFYALASAATGGHRLSALLATYAAGLAVNVYIVGLNQITDVEIDRINKPYLPIAAGAMSMQTATGVVCTAALLSLILAASQGPYLFATIGIVFFIGTAYSLPPLRLKRSPFWAAASITTARAVVFNIGLYMSFSAVLGGKPGLPAHVAMFVAFMLGFVIVIALMKDVPDIDGDRQHHISTLVIRLGATDTMRLCRVVLTFCYMAMIAAALAGMPGVNRALRAGSHTLFLVALWARGARVDASRKDDVYGYYMFIWLLFYCEFAAFAAACLLR